MLVLFAIALKSVIIAGATLGLLALMKQRSAAERSWVAHMGLVGLILIAVAPLVLPSWTVETSVVASNPPKVEAAQPAPVLPIQPSAVATAPAASEQASAAADESFSLSPAAIAAISVAGYAVPAAILLLVTFLALARLIALRARADVLVDGHWLSALARAQRRMGFKHGTALLTSDDLASPISWGFVRPVMLLNSRAVEAAGEAEAIISHELAHVARFDWVKLLLARIATALFWFNPLVWMLSREAHQLREETADDAVLAAEIQDTDYAQLLVGVARHECSGLLLGAHGVAPSKSSLARRIARVLDNASPRRPVARSFALGVLTGAFLIAAPLAALTLAPARTAAIKAGATGAATTGTAAAATAADPATPYYPEATAPTDLPRLIADGVSTAVAVVAPATFRDESLEATLERIGEQREQALEAAAEARARAAEQRAEALEAGRAGREAGMQARIDAAEARRMGQEAARAGREAARAGRQVAMAVRHRDPIDDAIEMKAVGVTPEYVAAMRTVSSRISRADASDMVGMKAVGVTPDYARDLANSGFPNLDTDDLTQARAVGLNGSYVRSMKAVGVRGTLDDYVELWTVGVRPDFVKRLRAAGYTTSDPDKLVEMQAVGLSVSDLRVTPPKPPRLPKLPPPNWNPLNDPNPNPDE